jgi:hypothetical protein
MRRLQFEEMLRHTEKRQETEDKVPLVSLTSLALPDTINRPT